MKPLLFLKVKVTKNYAVYEPWNKDKAVGKLYLSLDWLSNPPPGKLLMRIEDAGPEIHSEDDIKE